MKKVEAKQGRPVILSEGVGVVPAGVQRIMELQEQGFSYVRP
jgi:intracellular sulfur oxidation DsrE/DsrF family protein